MKMHRRRGSRSMCALAIKASFLIGCAQVEPQEAQESEAVASTAQALSFGDGATSTRRSVPAKPLRTELGPGVKHDEIVIKFVEGSQIRMRGDRLSFASNRLMAKHHALLQRAGLVAAEIPGELGNVEQILDEGSGLRRLIDLPETDVDRLKDNGENASGEELADMNLYYRLSVPEARAESIIDALNASPLVEFAAAPALAMVAASDISPTTSNMVSGQTYLDAAPTGIDARFAWLKAGGKGTNMKVIDFEWGWKLDHEDLPTSFVNIGTASTTQKYVDHGTAVLGEMVAADNGYGRTGIAPAASFGTASIASNSIATQLMAASNQLSAGDVILLEVQVSGPLPSPTNCTCGSCPPSSDSQYGYVAAEWEQQTFDAVKTATTNGLVVVAAAGNGQMNLDDARYNGAFTSRDSGAIIVGSGYPNIVDALCQSNYGSRVTSNAWGGQVPTLGYGDIKVNGTDQRQWYTNFFSGTSSAAPMVAGAVLAFQGTRKAAGQAPVDSVTMRFALQLNGTPQTTPVTHPVGTRPDLRCLLDGLQPASSAKIAAARQSTAVTTTFVRSCGGFGQFYRKWSSSGGAWQSASVAGNGVEVPKDASIALAAWGSNRLAAFFVGSDGKLYQYFEENDGAWQGPTALTAANFAPPGARVATGMQGTSKLDVFVIGGNGALNVLSSTSQGAFSAPSAITGTGYASPGAAIATGIYNSNQLDVFTIGFDGTLKAMWAVGTGAWQGPLNISASGVFPNGAPLVTGAQTGGQLDVFAIGTDGALKGYYTFFGAWFGPVNLTSAGFSNAGSEVAAIVWPSNQLNVFVMGIDTSTNGDSSQAKLNWLRVVDQGAWTGPTAIGGFDAYPGASIALATDGSNKLDLFMVRHGGFSRTSTTSATGPWSAFSLMP